MNFSGLQIAFLIAGGFVFAVPFMLWLFERAASRAVMRGLGW